MRKVQVDKTGKVTVTIQGSVELCRPGQPVEFKTESPVRPATAPEWASFLKHMPNGNIRFFDCRGVSFETHRPSGAVARGYAYVETSLALEKAG